MALTIAEALSQFDTCILADALDQLGLQLHNRGFTQPGLHCFGGSGTSVVGYAATARIRASEPPITGHTYFRHTEWWAELNRLPEPRIVVMEDIDRHPGSGACIGQLGAAIFKALGCAGAVTNGAVRDLPEISDMGFALFAGHVAPARAYSHLVDHSRPVEIYGLKIDPGDLLVADRHGVLSIPPQALPRLPAMALDIRERKRSFVEFCKSDAFNLETMENKLGNFQL